MKTLLIAMASIAITSCATPFVWKRTPHTKPTPYVWATNTVTTYDLDTTKSPVTQNPQTITVKRGDTVMTVSYVSGERKTPLAIKLYYELTDGRFVESKDLMSLDRWECVGSRYTAKVPRSQSEEAWSRATVWVNKNADLRIQTASDNLIDTYNPIGKDAFLQKGYTITRRVTADWVYIQIEGKGAASDNEWRLCDAYNYILGRRGE